jgi:thioredoxin-related protein
MTAKKVVLVSIILAAAILGCGAKETAERTEVENEWLSFGEGMALAEREKKPVVIDFYTSWCRWCKVMDEKTFSDPEVQSYLAEHFVSIRLNAESRSERYSFKGKQYTPVELTRAFGVRGFPSLAYLDRDGELITIVPGFIPKDTFLPFLHYIQKECYKQQMTFEDFLEKEEECEE